MDLSRILAPCDDTSDAVAAVAPRPSLPAHLLRAILASLVNKYAREKVRVAPRVALPTVLQAAASVSREWHALVRDTTAQLALAQLRGSVNIARRTEMLELRRLVTLQRAFLRTLVIEKAPLFGAIGDGHWAAVLSLVPQLEELHLTFRETQTLPRLAEIVRAAGQQCADLRTLALPAAPSARRLKPFQSSLDEFQDALYGALGAWSKNGVRPGVRELVVDMQHHIPDVVTTRAYIEKLIAVCPGIERIYGYMCTLRVYDEMTCDEQWMLDIPTWTAFCASLTKLTRFDWACVPFATAFFEIFGRHPKPKLKHMDMTPITNWKWASYMRALDSSTRETLTNTGYAFSAKNAHAVLRACPNLEELEVRWAFTTKDIGGRAAPHTRDGDDATPLRQFMNPEIINDEFCEAIAEHCPRLQRFTVQTMVEELPSNRVLRSLTDRGLRALAKLPFLSKVTIETPNITADGLYALAIEHNATESNALSRRFEFDVGEQFGARDDTFYKVVLAFLELVARHEAQLPCEHRDVMLEIRNKSKASVDAPSSQAFLTDIRALTKRIQTHHPATLVTIATSRYTAGTFARVEEFEFAIGPKASAETSLDEVEQIDDIVYNRIVEDEEDEDSEPDWDAVYGDHW